MARTVLSFARSHAWVRIITRAATVRGLSPSATSRVWSAQNTRGQASRMSPCDRRTAPCSEGCSARSSSAVLYMESLAGEKGRLPRCVMKRGAGDLLTAPLEFNRRKSRLVFDEGSGQAHFQDLGRGTGLPTSPGRFLDEKALQGFFDNGFLVRELAVFDLLSKQPLQIIFEGDVHHAESSQPSGLRMPLWAPHFQVTSEGPCLAKAVLVPGRTMRWLHLLFRPLTRIWIRRATSTSFSVRHFRQRYAARRIGEHANRD